MTDVVVTSKEFGLSNFRSYEVAEFVLIARKNGWVQPTVYQGIYNAVARTIEPE
jgi:aflatoxin B1 aldehyde reductase